MSSISVDNFKMILTFIYEDMGPFYMCTLISVNKCMLKLMGKKIFTLKNFVYLNQCKLHNWFHLAEQNGRLALWIAELTGLKYYLIHMLLEN